jgi:hypothetical protein
MWITLAIVVVLILGGFVCRRPIQPATKKTEGCCGAHPLRIGTSGGHRHTPPSTSQAPVVPVPDPSWGPCASGTGRSPPPFAGGRRAARDPWRVPNLTRVLPARPPRHAPPRHPRREDRSAPRGARGDRTGDGSEVASSRLHERPGRRVLVERAGGDDPAGWAQEGRGGGVIHRLRRRWLCGESILPSARCRR